MNTKNNDRKEFFKEVERRSREILASRDPEDQKYKWYAKEILRLSSRAISK